MPFLQPLLIIIISTSPQALQTSSASALPAHVGKGRDLSFYGVDGGQDMGPLEKNNTPISALLLNCPHGPSLRGPQSPTISKEGGLEDHYGSSGSENSRLLL